MTPESNPPGFPLSEYWQSKKCLITCPPCFADAADFFDREETQPAPAAASPKAKPVPASQASQPAATLPPEKNEEQIQKALYVGNFSAALDACFEVTPTPTPSPPSPMVPTHACIPDHDNQSGCNVTRCIAAPPSSYWQNSNF